MRKRFTFLFFFLCVRNIWIILYPRIQILPKNILRKFILRKSNLRKFQRGVTTKSIEDQFYLRSAAAWVHTKGGLAQRSTWHGGALQEMNLDSKVIFTLCTRELLDDHEEAERKTITAAAQREQMSLREDQSQNDFLRRHSSMEIKIYSEAGQIESCPAESTKKGQVSCHSLFKLVD